MHKLPNFSSCEDDSIQRQRFLRVQTSRTRGRLPKGTKGTEEERREGEPGKGSMKGGVNGGGEKGGDINLISPRARMFVNSSRNNAGGTTCFRNLIDRRGPDVSITAL